MKWQFKVQWIFCMCACGLPECVSVHHVQTQGGQKRTLGPQELELQMAVMGHVVLGVELWSSIRAANR